MSRRAARKHAFILIFQAEFHDSESHAEIIDNYIEDLEDVTEAEKSFVKNEFIGVIENKAYLDGIIKKFAEGWTIDRISRVDLSILRLCIYEMLKVEDIPESVSINEAVELAKSYGGDNSSSFINGILANVSKEKNKL